MVPSAENKIQNFKGCWRQTCYVVAQKQGWEVRVGSIFSFTFKSEETLALKDYRTKNTLHTCIAFCVLTKVTSRFSKNKGQNTGNCKLYKKVPHFWNNAGKQWKTAPKSVSVLSEISRVWKSEGVWVFKRVVQAREQIIGASSNFWFGSIKWHWGISNLGL